MSRYEWPRVASPVPAGEDHDDPAARARFNATRRAGSSVQQVLEALRVPAAEAASARRDDRTGRSARPVRPRAPATSDLDLWQPLGPSALLGGQAEGSPRVSGRVNALVVHPDGQRAYAASANGGVWATTDGGANWRSVAGLAATDTAGVSRPAHRNACAALHVVWPKAAGDKEIVFMGTGEPTPSTEGRAGDAEAGLGIFVAEDPLTSALADPWVREAPNLVNDSVYRIVASPDGATLVAATYTGLYQRPVAPGAGVAWSRVAGTPFGSGSRVCSDALWTAGDPVDATPANQRRPARLWVWVQDGPQNGLWVRDDGQTDFQPVTVDAANSAFAFGALRGVLAAVARPTKVWLLLDGDPTPRLFRVTNPRPVDGSPTALAVEGVPNVLRDSGWYNIALAVDPSDEDRLAMAGSYLGNPRAPADRDLLTTRDGARRSYDASIVLDKVVANPANAARLVYGTGPRADKMVGIGVHPDVHALEFSNNGATLWTGCDGGVYRSDRPASAAGFRACNQGLSVSETNYIAVSPTFEGDVVAGLQDNGVIARLSGGVWRVVHVGDGGGVVRDPRQPERWIAQYTRGTWSSEAVYGKSGPLFRTPAVPDAEKNGAAFYSTPAVIGHERDPSPAPKVKTAQLLIGTDRLWYSDDFGANWVTLPTGTDPLVPAGTPPTVNTVQDSVGEPLLMCRWQDPDTAWVLTAGNVYRYRRTPGSHNPAGPGTWAAIETVLAKSGPPPPAPPPPAPTPEPRGKRKKRADAAPADPAVPVHPVTLLRAAVSWTEIEPNLLPAAGGNPAVGALYMGTTGNADEAGCDTLWWFDGAAAWVPTGLRARGNKGQPWPAPVTALLVDPLRPEEVWVGTTVGVLRGVRSAVAAPAAGEPAWKWDWEPLLNGLPEAAVEDLSLYHDTGPEPDLRLLRAAIASRGVWELRLDARTVAPLTYLRVHAGDLRHRDEARLLKADGTLRSWHDSPDVRPRLAPSTSLAAPTASKPWWRGPINVDAERLRRFQAALRSSTNDPRIVGNGLWDAYFSELLRDHAAPTTTQVAPAPPAGAPALPDFQRVFIDRTYFRKHFKGAHRTAEPWGPGTATEADLYDHTPPLTDGEPGLAKCALPARPWRVEVVVHQRGRAPVEGGDVRVTLLWWADPAAKNKARFDQPVKWAPGAVAWAATVQAMLNSADGASAALPAGWHYAGTTAATRRTTLAGRTLDPMNAGVASFPLALPALKKDTVVLLVAVVRAGGDVVLAPDTSLEALTRGNPAVAVRAVRIV